MLKEILPPSGSLAATLISWFFGGLFNHWFFGQVMGMGELLGGNLGILIEYGPPIIFASITIFLMWRIFRRHNANRISEPNMRLEDVLKRIVGRSTLPLPDETDSALILNACERLREKALLGVIDVFGGINRGATRLPDYDSMIRDKIGPEYWRSHQINAIGLLGNNDMMGRTTASDPFAEGFGDTDSNYYYGIWFNRNQIDAIWPPPRRRTKFRSPVTLERA